MSRIIQIIQADGKKFMLLPGGQVVKIKPYIKIADPVIKECVRQIGLGKMEALGVMADRMDDTGDSNAKEVRKEWEHLNEKIGSNPNQPNGRTRKYCGCHLRRSRLTIMKIFNRRWKDKSWHQMYETNQGWLPPRRVSP